MHRHTFSRKYLGIPYAFFLLLFVVAPLVVLICYAFTNGQGEFTVQNLTGFFSDPNTLGTLCYSFGIAMVTTAVCLLLAYPLAFILATSKLKGKSVIVLIFIMPMWINFSLRITALKEILTWLEGNLAYHPFLNTVLGMSYDFLPFMILPIYTTISKLDGALLEAARIDGAGEVHMCHKLVLPILAPGIATMSIGAFIGNWNNYLVPLILLNTPDKMTLPVMISTLNAATDLQKNQGAIYLGVAISVVPILIVFCFCSKYIISSITAGSVKE